MQPTITHPTDRPNFTIVRTAGIAYGFSYETCVAANNGNGWIVRRNDWGPTTGKHLNYFDDGDKSTRLDAATFSARLAEMESAR